MNRNDVFVIAETDRSGKLYNVGIELMGPGREIAEKQHGRLCAVTVGYQLDEAVRTLSGYGADVVYRIEGQEYQNYMTELYTDAIHQLIVHEQPETVLIGATVNGRDLAPRLAKRLNTGLTADCTQISYDDASGNVLWTRPAFGGNLMAEIICAEARPQIGTVRPGVFPKPEKTGENAEVITFPVTPETSGLQKEIIEIAESILDTNEDISEAEILVSGGRGIGGPEGFALLKELADQIGGVVSASRAAVDAGWISRAKQVGQSGKTVSPKLYIACGISGSVQHYVGMKNAGTVIAVNTDPEADIFRYADYGIVGDYKSVIPAIIAALKNRKDEEA